MLRRTVVLALLLAASHLLTGCCGMPISCQYGAKQCGHSGDCTLCGCGTCGEIGCPDGRHAINHPLLAHHDPLGPNVPPGESVPRPKFHPVPTRPVFEAQPCYPPPQFIPSGGHLPPLSFEPVPTPAQPAAMPE